MKFISTRGGVAPVQMREALEAGLAPDGGLFIPESFPVFSPYDFKDLKTLPEIAASVLKPFFLEDEVLSKKLSEICENSFNFPIPLTKVPGSNLDYILELYHGPTSAFKDVGAQFLANCISALGDSSPKTVLVATSGDTGGAVAAAFFKKPSIEVMILYPKGKISPRQEKQLCAWGENVKAFGVEGTFDDCQRIVKEALLDQESKRKFISANSINLGRILPQMIYYIYASLLLQDQKNSPGFIIPSGNLGNSLACIWAKRLGFRIGPIFLALNANRGVVDYMKTGELSSNPTIATLANAMDVSKPSNLERMVSMMPDQAESVSDPEIENEIRVSESRWGQAFCPHTATAGVVRSHLKDQKDQAWVLVSTAHPAKFETIVEPLVGHAIELPPALEAILKKPSRVETIQATYEALKGKFKG